MRRVGRVKAIRAKHRRRLLAAAILPVALYAAEHTPWDQREVDRLANTAARVAGLAVFGVPMEVSRLLLQAEVHPEWKVWWAAIERWAREVWISRHRQPGGFPADALLEGELDWAWAISTKDGGPASAEECPALAAIVAALDGLRLGWPEAGTLRCLVTGQEWDLREGSPALLKKLLKARWWAGQRAKLSVWLQTRSNGI
jgi:hypothetical protein